MVDVNHNCGDGTGADGYDNAANYTGGEILDICNNSWASQITNLSAASLANIFRYELSQGSIDQGSIQVYVDDPWTCWRGRIEHVRRMKTTLLLWWIALGLEISWRKMQHGTTVKWI